MSAEERLIRYCQVDTQSDPSHEDVTPSSQKQFDLAKILKEELEELGLKDVVLDEHCYVYGKLPSNLSGSVKKVGFIAHMDTAPDFSGTNVMPRIIECFDGEDIVLNDTTVTRMSDFPQMKELKGKRLMVTDGTTLLGADDKAGIVAIMEALVYLKEHPEYPHGEIRVGFTPDEEIGNGTKYFNIEQFDADFAYTMDGGTVSELSDETFNAASAVVKFQGFSIHPGSAKNKMINAARIATQYQQALPEYMTPEHTEDREGFIHLHGMQGNVESAVLDYIIRDHDKQKLEEKKEILKKACEYFNTVYGKQVCTIEIRDSYPNMKSVLQEKPEAVDIAWKVLEGMGFDVVNEPVRGGTDGAMLTIRGLPCPNLGAGGGNFHGPYEYCVMGELEQATEVILKIISEVAEEA
ncbi:MAG: peptidase T [Solobacterium sp.]|nr:peptidase T [Solobacterium sp.]